MSSVREPLKIPFAVQIGLIPGVACTDLDETENEYHWHQREVKLGCVMRCCRLVSRAAIEGGTLLSPLSAIASIEIRISTQAPPNGKQIGGSNPIYLSPFYVGDDREVFGCGFNFFMRKAELCLSTSYYVGHTSRSVLQVIEDVTANQSAMRKPTHDTEVPAQRPLLRLDV